MCFDMPPITQSDVIESIAGALQHIVGWMDQWLQGKTNPSYATP